MNAFRRIVADIGIILPSDPHLVVSAVAIVLVVAAGAIAWYAGRAAGPRLANLWERHAGGLNEGIAPRMCGLVRYLTASILLAILLKAYGWPVLASFVIGDRKIVV